jgi:hypothetical protein
MTSVPPAAPSLRRRTALVAAAVLLLATGALGFAIGSIWTSHRTELGGWHTGVGRVGADQVSIDYDGWTYGASGAVGAWLDQDGTWHDDGWPTCLRHHVGDDLEVRFQAREVVVDGTTWRPVVAVDCRATSPAG